MEIRKVEKDKKKYLALLLLADEQEDMIDRYLERCLLYTSRAHVCPVVCRFKTNSWAGWPNSSVSLLSEKPRRL